jgi:hypothetical protein
MLTWEEAGLLRSMLQVTIWGIFLLALAFAAVVERKPLLTGAKAAMHRIETAIHPATLGSSPARHPS